MPKPHPREFREDVIRVARHREPGVRIKEIAADFGTTTRAGHELTIVGRQRAIPTGHRHLRMIGKVSSKPLPESIAGSG